MSNNIIQFKARKGESGSGAQLVTDDGAFRWFAVISYPSGEERFLTFNEFTDLGEFMERGSEWTGARLTIRHYEVAEQSA